MTDHRMLLVLRTHPYVASYIRDSIEKSNKPHASANMWFHSLWLDLTGDDFDKQRQAKKLLLTFSFYESAMRLCMDHGLVEVRRLDDGHRRYVPTVKGMLVTSLMCGWVAGAADLAHDVYEAGSTDPDDPDEPEVREETLSALRNLLAAFEEAGMCGWTELDNIPFIGLLVGGKVVEANDMFLGWPPRLIATSVV
jgi:hypothetical protein